MAVNRVRIRRVAQLTLVGAGLLLLWLIITAISGSWLIAGAGLLLGLMAFSTRLWLGVPAVGIALLMAQWLLVPILLIGVVAALLPRIGRVSGWIAERDDEALLGAAVSLDPAIVAALSDNPAEPVTTTAILVAAKRELTAFWNGLLPGAATTDDGDLLDLAGRQWSVCACESAALAQRLAAASGKPLDLQMLAVAALLVPESAAAAWVSPAAKPAAVIARHTGIDELRQAQLTMEFVKSTEGSDAMRRIEAKMRADGLA
jgi:hypothetical protein